MKPTADQFDLALLRQKDAAEFTRFVKAHEELVMGLCQSLGLAPADIDDAAAESFAIAYRSLPGFRGEAQLSTWLYRIACRTALKIRKTYPRSGETILDREDPEAPHPAEHLAQKEAHAAVWSALQQLEPDHAVAVDLFYRRQMSVEEVAAIMEKPAGTIKTLLFRARERLRFLLRRLENHV